MVASSKMQQEPKRHVEFKWWVNFGAGGLASCISKGVMNPMQRIIVQKQLGHMGSVRDIVHTILDEDRLHKLKPCEVHPPLQIRHSAAFFRGLTATMFQRFPYSGIQLACYSRTHRMLESIAGVQPGDTTSTLAVGTKLVASAWAATVSGTATYPIEVVRNRMMSGDKSCRTISGSCKEVVNEFGYIGFYKGLGPSLLQRIPDIIINLTVYFTVRETLKKEGYDDQVCVCSGGAAAALTAILFTYPLDLVKRRMAVGRSGKGPVYATSTDCFKEIFRTQGVRGLYAGATLECVRCVPQVILMWQLIEYFRTQFKLLDTEAQEQLRQIAEEEQMESSA